MTDQATTPKVTEFGPGFSFGAIDADRGDFVIFRTEWEGGEPTRVFLDIVVADNVEAAIAKALTDIAPHDFCPTCCTPHLTEVTGMQACESCGSLIGAATQDDFDKEVIMSWDTTPEDQVTFRAFDVVVDGRRIHGFMNEDNGRITQIG